MTSTDLPAPGCGEALGAGSPTVLGLDLSLTCTGWANHATTGTLKPKKLIGLDRLRWITAQALTLAQQTSPELVAVEGPSYGSVGSGQHERGGLWWYVVDALDNDCNPVVIVPPSVVKKYATGKGNAGKDEVLLAASRRFDWFEGGNDEADALWLAAIAGELSGSPLVEMPAAHRVRLASKVSWVREVAA